MPEWLQMILTIIGSVAASSGFWAFIQKKTDKNSNQSKLLLGLAHDRIMYLGMVYIDRGYITQDEYENIHEYLFVPYEASGGNGSAKRIMIEVNTLPIRKAPPMEAPRRR